MSQSTGIINNPCSSSSPVWHVRVRAIDRAIFVWPWKNIMVSVSVRYYLFCQPINVKIKTWSLRFPAKENPNVEKALFDRPIVLQYDVEAKYRLISKKFFGREVFSLERSLSQPKASRVCIRSLNQSNRSISSISVSLLFLFCSRVFVSRSFENRGASSFLNDSSLNYLTRRKSFKMFFTFSRLIL